MAKCLLGGALCLLFLGGLLLCTRVLMSSCPCEDLQAMQFDLQGSHEPLDNIDGSEAANSESRQRFNLAEYFSEPKRYRAVAPLISIIISVMFWVYRYQYLFWNTVCRCWYRAPRQIVKVGEPYRFALSSLPQLQGKEDQMTYTGVFIMDEGVPGGGRRRPFWIEAAGQAKTISGTPCATDVGISTVRVSASSGCILAEFELRVYCDDDAGFAESWRALGP